MASSTPAGFSKLTVPQLKALCKERKITGYSKLSKPALVQKLVEACGSGSLAPVATLEPPGSSNNVSNAPNNPLPRPKGEVFSGILSNPSAEGAERINRPEDLVAVTSRDQNPAPGRMAGTKATGTCAADVIPLGSSSSAAYQIARSAAIPAQTSVPRSSADRTSPTHSLATAAAPSSRDLSASPPNISPATATKDPPVGVPTKRAAVSSDELPSKGAKLAVIPQVASKPFSIATSTAKLPAAGIKIVTTSPHSSSASIKATIPTSAPRIQVSHKLAAVHLSATSKNAKRFRPLISGTRQSQTVLPRPLPVRAPPTDGPFCHRTDEACPLVHLDFPPALPVPTLHAITLPPPLSQRKRVQRWAIILSGLDDESRGRCVLVSRTFRYAVYLSAIHILDCKFRGKRSARDMKPYSHAMTNFWPYLRTREKEAANRERIYARSFLRPLEVAAKLVSISPRLWASPDHDIQATVAARFAITSFWFALSIGGRASEDWLSGTVVDTQEVVSHEIWSVTLECQENFGNIPRLTRFYVLEQTCEVIGFGVNAWKDDVGLSCLGLRVDWSAYIQDHMNSSRNSSQNSLLQHLKWANYEEYERGISRLWLKRIAQEGEVGRAKRVIAERYVLACVIANSISGRWMSTHEMAQDFAGLPSRHGFPSVKANNSDLPLNLFLPANHHVESVHFTSSSKLPLHPALAVVQTPAREYFVLKDNGFEVGCEEESVAPLWMEILRCNGMGIPF